MSIEDDVARVNAVTDALVGPTKVWILFNDDSDGSHMYAYASEAVARESWANMMTSFLQQDGRHLHRLQECLTAIGRGETSLECPSEDYWSLHCEIVQTAPFV